jgi:hypothetical protein
MIISNKKLVSILTFLVIYLSFFSVTLNQILFPQTGLSIVNPLIIGIYLLAIRHIVINKTLDKSFKRYLILILLLLGIFFLNFLMSKNYDSLKNIFYILLSLSLAICIHTNSNSGEILLKRIVFVFIVATCILVFQFIQKVVIGGVSIANFNHLMFFYKQEYTMFYTVVISCLAYYYFETYKSRYLIYSGLVTFFCILVGIKSILFVLLCLFISVYLFKNLTKGLKLLIYGLIATLVLFYSFPILFESIMPFVEYFFGGSGGFDKVNYRNLETLFVREYIISENLNLIFNNWITILFGTGVNAVKGGVYVSEYTNLIIDAPKALESGLLFFLVHSGLLGTIIILFLFIYPFISMNINTNRVAPQSLNSSPKIYIYVLFSIFCSNIFQDNVSTLTWIFLGLGIASIVNSGLEATNLDENH